MYIMKGKDIQEWTDIEQVEAIGWKDRKIEWTICGFVVHYTKRRAVEKDCGAKVNLQPFDNTQP